MDLSLYAGDGASLRLAVKTSQGAAYDLTGDVLAQIRQQRDDTDPLVSFAVDMTTASSGSVLLTLTGDQTSQLVAEGAFTGAWDVQWTPAGEEPTTLLQGAVTCALDVTR